MIQIQVDAHEIPVKVFRHVSLFRTREIIFMSKQSQPTYTAVMSATYLLTELLFSIYAYLLNFYT